MKLEASLRVLDIVHVSSTTNAARVVISQNSTRKFETLRICVYSLDVQLIPRHPLTPFTEYQDVCKQRLQS